MSKCKDCHKEVICETPQFSECVSYEGFIAEASPLHGECAVNVKMVLEDLYQTYGAEGFQYFAGEGLELNNRTFSVDFGTTSGTVMEGSWRPMWSDIINRPNIPEQVNIMGGDNVTVTGTYPNITINAEANTERVNIVGGTNVTVGGGYPEFIINATHTPTTHTGDVTGTTSLTITNSAVTNQKLANSAVTNQKLADMPANTIKGRMNPSGVPQDLTPQQAKDVIGVKQKTVVTLSTDSEYILTLDREMTTGVFLAEETKGLTVPNGQFDGQYIHISSPDSVSLQGNLIDWTGGETTPSPTGTVGFRHSAHLFWSADKSAWLITRRIL